MAPAPRRKGEGVLDAAPSDRMHMHPRHPAGRGKLQVSPFAYICKGEK